MRSPFCLSRLTAISLTLIAAPALAQDNGEARAGDRDPGIVVQGERPAGEVDGTAVRAQARSIIAPESRATTYIEAVARFQRPICPGVVGLTPGNAQDVIERIYRNAEAVGLEIDDAPGCTGNVWVIIVNDAGAVFDQLRRENSFLLRGISHFARNRIEEQTGPTRAWNAIQLRTEGGMPVESINTPWMMSRLRANVREDIELSVVLIERRALARFDAYAIADFATMRLLTQTRPPTGDVAYDTVLQIFDETAAMPATARLSAFDLAYLRTIYDSHRMAPSTAVFGRVGRRMERDLAAAAGDSR
ncbi:hypothetical protein [Aurantiacibacter luteus]|uniref:DUF2927 domain-containing protein n=1 Tax=Aurantiacibacter luteus TaxID=1581420 RepID=A0A0G9MVN7_9SPHN|nr:hypothetical protein [Aurantiacibacter luteus]KLE34786.1 hypothetical protein AAW00_11645 [Aurantiacibacter luteus]